MKQLSYKSLGIDIKLNVPETVDEFDLNAKKTGACLLEATNNVIYRGSLAEFRDAFCAAVEDATGISRGTEPILDKENKPRVDKDGAPMLKYTETEADYFKRVCAEKSVEPSSFQAIADKVAEAIVFDASATERQPAGPKKLAQKYQDDAKKILAFDDAKLAKVNKRFNDALGKSFTSTGDAEKDVQTLGWLVKEFSDWNAAQASLKLTA